MVDRGLRDAEFLGEHLHAGAVVALVVEHLHGHGQERIEVVAGTSGEAGASSGACRSHVPIFSVRAKLCTILVFTLAKRPNVRLLMLESEKERM